MSILFPHFIFAPWSWDDLHLPVAQCRLEIGSHDDARVEVTCTSHNIWSYSMIILQGSPSKRKATHLILHHDTHDWYKNRLTFTSVQNHSDVSFSFSWLRSTLTSQVHVQSTSPKTAYVCNAWPHTNSSINSVRARDCQNRTQLILCSIKIIQITVFKIGDWALSCWYRGDHGCPYLYKLWCCNIKCNIQIEHSLANLESWLGLIGEPEYVISSRLVD